jgi:protein-disulfide isomerase
MATTGIKGDPELGSATAPVTIVEFSDFECPYCKKFHNETFTRLKEEYIDKGLVRFIHKDLPLPFHSNAHPAAVAARCAQEDGKYWEVYQALFNQQNCLTCKGPNGIAETAGVNKKNLERCRKSKQIRQAININISEAELNAIQATPTFILGPSSKDLHKGRIIEGALPWNDLKSQIDHYLTKPRGTR